MRIVTWNIRGSLGRGGRQRLRRACDELGGLEADVLCLQEVHRLTAGPAALDPLRFVAAALRMEATFGAGFAFGPWQCGVAILTRASIAGFQVHALPNEEERRARPWMRLERRIALEAEVAGDVEPLTVLCTHWSLATEDRLRGAEQVASRIWEVEGPAVVCGDLNAHSGSMEVQALLGLANLRDCGGPATFPASSPHARIDFVLIPEGWTCLGIHAPSWPWSDHLPLVADVSRETYQG